jgi:hypothetical protein
MTEIVTQDRVPKRAKSRMAADEGVGAATQAH